METEPKKDPCAGCGVDLNIYDINNKEELLAWDGNICSVCETDVCDDCLAEKHGHHMEVK